MVLVGAFLVPHGALLLDPSMPEYSKVLDDAMRKTAESITALKPEVIVLVTPHGIAAKEELSFYLNSRAEGSAEWKGKYGQFRVSVPLASSLSNQLVDQLNSKGIGHVQGVTGFVESEPMPLRWGEVVPLHYLRHLEGVEYVMISQPTRRHTDVEALFEEESALGYVLGKQLTGHDAPYPQSPAAEKFDAAIRQWATTLDYTHLRNALSHSRAALSCGITGLGLLTGVLAEKSVWQGTEIAYGHPTYYGMLLASFLPKLAPVGEKRKAEDKR